MQQEPKQLDYRPWGKREYLTARQIGRLLCGIDGDLPDDVPVPDAVREIIRRAETSINAGTIRWNASLAEWIKWADRMEIDVPPELRNAVPPDAQQLEEVSHQARSAHVDEKSQPKEAVSKGRHYMLLAIGGMAAANYGFDFRKPKIEGHYEVAKRIVRDLGAKGIPFSEQTIAGYLKEAVPLLREGAAGK